MSNPNQSRGQTFRFIREKLVKLRVLASKSRNEEEIKRSLDRCERVLSEAETLFTADTIQGTEVTVTVGGNPV